MGILFISPALSKGDSSIWKSISINGHSKRAVSIGKNFKIGVHSISLKSNRFNLKKSIHIDLLVEVIGKNMSAKFGIFATDFILQDDFGNTFRKTLDKPVKIKKAKKINSKGEVLLVHKDKMLLSLSFAGEPLHASKYLELVIEKGAFQQNDTTTVKIPIYYPDSATVMKQKASAKRIKKSKKVKRRRTAKRVARERITAEQKLLEERMLENRLVENAVLQRDKLLKEVKAEARADKAKADKLFWEFISSLVLLAISLLYILSLKHYGWRRFFIVVGIVAGISCGILSRPETIEIFIIRFLISGGVAVLIAVVGRKACQWVREGFQIEKVAEKFKNNR